MKKKNKNKDKKSKIKWIGYPISHITWEPITNISKINNINDNNNKINEKIQNYFYQKNIRENNFDKLFINKKRNFLNEECIEEDEINKFDYYFLNKKYKKVYTIKKINCILYAIVIFEKNGNLEKIIIPTEQLKILNPYILINFYEERIQFS